MEVSISEAARLARVSRNTLYKKHKSGQLSLKRLDDDSGFVVDTAELMRVYPSLQVGDSAGHEVTVEELQQQIEALEAESAAKDRLLEERDRSLALQGAHLSDLRRLLEQPVQKQPEQPASPPGFWGRLFGRA
jgi:hypothetical protein